MADSRCDSRQIRGREVSKRFDIEVEVERRIAEARAEEREACAKIAQNPIWTSDESVCETIATAIRARSNHPEGK